LPAGAEGALGHFFQHVVAADGFNDFFLGLVAVIVIAFVADRCGGMFGMLRGDGLAVGMFRMLAAAMFGMRGVVGMG
jgi:hypothetical protein